MKNGLVIFLCFIVLASLAISFVALGPVDLPDLFGKDSDKSTSTNASVVPQGVYVDGAYGYQTVGKVTYFFKHYTITSSMENCWFEMRDYDSYAKNVFFSWDLNTWRHPSGCTGYHDYPAGIDKISSGGDYYTEIFVCYTTITNCEDPVSVLNDLKKNVFENRNYFFVSFVDSAGSVTEAPAA